ncbi:MAG TPA: family 10 glycosylhydrolase [Firmicutes bacterium]|nr:family 10 glycosylhydrolase [Bacillota bacterium]
MERHYRGVRTLRQHYDELGWDPLDVLADEARQCKISVHPYLAAHVAVTQIPNWHSPLGEWYPVVMANEFAAAHPELWRALRSGENTMSRLHMGILSPAFPEARGYEAGVFAGIAARYQVDGVQVEFLAQALDKHGVSELGYEEPVVVSFRASRGRDPYQIENADEEWVTHRAAYTTVYMREVIQSAKAVRDGVHVDVTVISRPSRLQYLGQFTPWWEWQGIDSLCLWHLTDDPGRVHDETEWATIKAPGGTAVVAQLACYGQNRLNNAELLLEAGRQAVDAGARRLGVYRADAVESLGLWAAVERLAAMGS